MPQIGNTNKGIIMMMMIIIIKIIVIIIINYYLDIAKKIRLDCFVDLGLKSIIKHNIFELGLFE